MDEDLSLVTTDVLLDELTRRFACMVFVGAVDANVSENTLEVRELREWRQDGDVTKSVGLAHWVAHKILIADGKLSSDLDE